VFVSDPGKLKASKERHTSKLAFHSMHVREEEQQQHARITAMRALLHLTQSLSVHDARS